MVLKSLARGQNPSCDPEIPPSLQARVTRTTRWTPLTEVSRHDAEDGTRKLLLQLHDGHAVECVLIPQDQRTTLCVSSQVGCRRGCGFCMTATMGLIRNLDAGEIVGQVHAALTARQELPPLRNLVFMGMGEPLDNPVAVEAALRVLTDTRGYGFAPRHVTVSTVAPSPAAVARAARWPGHFAWSLHAADDGLRRSLVASQRFETQALADAVLAVCRARNQPLFVEITLMQGVNDRPEDAERVAELFQDCGVEVRFNLLPMNPGRGLRYQPASQEQTRAFEAVLRARGYFTHLRKARGQDANAACGQLAVLKLAPDPGPA